MEESTPLVLGHARLVFLPLAALVEHDPFAHPVTEGLAGQLGALEEVGRLAQVAWEAGQSCMRLVDDLRRKRVAALDAAQSRCEHERKREVRVAARIG